MELDTVAVHDRRQWWLPSDVDRREEATFQLPPSTIELIAKAEQALGIAASDLVTFWARRAVPDALARKDRELDMLLDHSRITGWLPDGGAVTRD